jgi:predicted extracellular nuclease
MAAVAIQSHPENDFIEIFNKSSEPVNLAGWSVQYASATGSTWQVTELTDFILQPGQYYLVQQAQGSGGSLTFPPLMPQEQFPWPPAWKK